MNPPPDFTVQVQFTELYNEEVIDLLSRPSSSGGGSARGGHGHGHPPVKIHEQVSLKDWLLIENSQYFSH